MSKSKLVRFDERKILFKIHDASRAGLTPSPTCPPGQGGLRESGIAPSLPVTRRELEHHAASRPAAKYRSAIEIAVFHAVGNLAGSGIRISPVAAQHRLGWSGRGAACRRHCQRGAKGRKSPRQVVQSSLAFVALHDNLP